MSNWYKGHCLTTTDKRIWTECRRATGEKSQNNQHHKFVCSHWQTTVPSST